MLQLMALATCAAALAPWAAAHGDALELRAADGGLSVSVTAADGSYSVAVDGVPWLASGGPPDHLGSQLSVLDHAASSGTDRHGAFSATTVRWRLAAGSGGGGARTARGEAAVLETEFKAYEGKELLAFTQRWPHGVANTSAFYNESTAAGLPLGRFPSFGVGNSSKVNTELNWFTFRGCQIQFSGFGHWASSGHGSFSAAGPQQTMPLVLYDRGGPRQGAHVDDRVRAVALSPSGNFFNAVHDTASSGGAVLAAGVMASVWTLPPNFTHTTLLAAGRGMNATMGTLGAALLAETGKTPVNPLNESFVLSHLGYWALRWALRPRQESSAVGLFNPHPTGTRPHIRSPCAVCRRACGRSDSTSFGFLLPSSVFRFPLSSLAIHKVSCDPGGGPGGQWGALLPHQGGLQRLALAHRRIRFRRHSGGGRSSLVCQTRRVRTGGRCSQQNAVCVRAPHFNGYTLFSGMGSEHRLNSTLTRNKL